MWIFNMNKHCGLLIKHFYILILCVFFFNVKYVLKLFMRSLFLLHTCFLLFPKFQIKPINWRKRKCYKVGIYLISCKELISQKEKTKPTPTPTPPQKKTTKRKTQTNNENLTRNIYLFKSSSIITSYSSYYS